MMAATSPMLACTSPHGTGETRFCNRPTLLSTQSSIVNSEDNNTEYENSAISAANCNEEPYLPTADGEHYDAEYQERYNSLNPTTASIESNLGIVPNAGDSNMNSYQTNQFYTTTENIDYQEDVEVEDDNMYRDPRLSGQTMEEFFYGVLNTEADTRKLGANRIFLCRLQQDYSAFIADNNSDSSQNVACNDAWQRLLAHRTAVYYGLSHNTRVDGAGILVQKTTRSRIPLWKFNEHIEAVATAAEGQDQEQPKMLLKRDANDFEVCSDMKPNDERSGRSYAERAVNYNTVRNRIFNNNLNSPECGLSFTPSTSNDSPVLILSRSMHCGMKTEPDYKYDPASSYPSLGSQEARTDTCDGTFMDDLPTELFFQLPRMGEGMADRTGSEPEVLSEEPLVLFVACERSRVPAGSMVIDPRTMHPYLNPDGSRYRVPDLCQTSTNAVACSKHCDTVALSSSSSLSQQAQYSEGDAKVEQLNQPVEGIVGKPVVTSGVLSQSSAQEVITGEEKTARNEKASGDGQSHGSSVARSSASSKSNYMKQASTPGSGNMSYRQQHARDSHGSHSGSYGYQQTSSHHHVVHSSIPMSISGSGFVTAAPNIAIRHAFQMPPPNFSQFTPVLSSRLVSPASGEAPCVMYYTAPMNGSSPQGQEGLVQQMYVPGSGQSFQMSGLPVDGISGGAGGQYHFVQHAGGPICLTPVNMPTQQQQQQPQQLIRYSQIMPATAAVQLGGQILTQMTPSLEQQQQMMAAGQLQAAHQAVPMGSNIGEQQLQQIQLVPVGHDMKMHSSGAVVQDAALYGQQEQGGGLVISDLPKNIFVSNGQGGSMIVQGLQRPSFLVPPPTAPQQQSAGAGYTTTSIDAAQTAATNTAGYSAVAHAGGFQVNMVPQQLPAGYPTYPVNVLAPVVSGGFQVGAMTQSGYPLANALSMSQASYAVSNASTVVPAQQLILCSPYSLPPPPSAGSSLMVGAGGERLDQAGSTPQQGSNSNIVGRQYNTPPPKISGGHVSTVTQSPRTSLAMTQPRVVSQVTSGVSSIVIGAGGSTAVLTATQPSGGPSGSENSNNAAHTQSQTEAVGSSSTNLQQTSHQQAQQQQQQQQQQRSTTYHSKPQFHSGRQMAAYSQSPRNQRFVPSYQAGRFSTPPPSHPPPPSFSGSLPPPMPPHGHPMSYMRPHHRPYRHAHHE